MARIDTLSNFLTDIANAIRNKKGSADLIQASQFDTEINNITGATIFDIAPSGSGTTLTLNIANNYPDYANLTLDNIIAMPLQGLYYSSSATNQQFTWEYNSATGALTLTTSNGRFSANIKNYAWRIAIV